MPKIKKAQKKQGPAERLQEVRAAAAAKKKSGQKTTVADLEERIQALEELIAQQL